MRQQPPTPPRRLAEVAVLKDARREPEQIDFAEVVVEFAAPTRPARVYLEMVRMPKTRAGCEDDGVCLALRCRHNTTLEVTKRGGIMLNAAGYSGPGRTLWVRRGDGHARGFERDDLFDERVVAKLAETECNCTLDKVKAAPDGMTFDQVAAELGTRTRQRVEQIEKRALAKLKRECDRLGITLDDFLGEWRHGRG